MGGCVAGAVNYKSRWERYCIEKNEAVMVAAEINIEPGEKFECFFFY